MQQHSIPTPYMAGEAGKVYNLTVHLLFGGSGQTAWVQQIQFGHCICPVKGVQYSQRVGSLVKHGPRWKMRVLDGSG